MFCAAARQDATVTKNRNRIFALFLLLALAFCQASFAQEAPTPPGKDADDATREKFYLEIERHIANVFKLAGEEENPWAPKPRTPTEVELLRKQLELDGYSFTPAGFLDAVKAGNMAAMLRYLDAGMPVNTTNTSNQNALFFAIIGDQIPMAQALIGYGVRVNMANTLEETPLMIAVAKGNPHMVALLLDARADPNTSNQNGWNSLHYAVYDNNIPMAALLIARGADIDHINKLGYTPLMQAAWKGFEEMARFLIKMGASPVPRDNNGNNALLVAVTYKQYDIAKFLLQNGANPNDENYRGWKALDIALDQQDMDMANLLYAYGATTPGTQLPVEMPDATRIR
ncbi:MAG: hypothetical protein GC134_09410 [Proteobacteria bacterium]|nr:hypothetical protein [Pseudomonadota bacterium]